MTDNSALIEQADEILAHFISLYGSSAVPALLGSCVNWAVQSGRAAQIKHGLNNAIELTDILHAEWVKGLS